MLEISRDGSSRVGSGGVGNLTRRIESGRVRRCWKSHGTDRVGSGQEVLEIARDGSSRVGSSGVGNLTGRMGVGPGQEVLNYHGVGPGQPDPIQPATKNPACEKPCIFHPKKLFF